MIDSGRGASRTVDAGGGPQSSRIPSSGPAAPADGSGPVYGSAPDGSPAASDWQSSIDFPMPDGPAAPPDWSVLAPADGSVPAGPWSPDQPYETDAPQDADRTDRDPEEAEWATGDSPATGDWSAEPLVAPVDFSPADPLALPDWSVSTDTAAVPGGAPAADGAIDDTLSTNGPLAVDDTLSTDGPLAVDGSEAVGWSVPAASRAPARPQEADAGQGGAHGNGPDRDPEGTEQTSEDQDRRYRSNPYVAADEADSPWEGRSS